jgi:hypothetical protein
MLYLSQVLDAKLVLFLNHLDVDIEIATHLEAAIAQFPERNLMFLKDAFAAWKRHAENPTSVKTVGELRWQWAALKLRNMPQKVLPFVDRPHITRLMGMLRNFSEKCTFGRLGDTVVKESLMVVFPPVLLASLGHTEAPYKKASTFLNEDFNDVVQALIKTSPTDRLVGVAWKTTRDCRNLAFIACLGWEMLGQALLPKLLKNHEIVYAENGDTAFPQLCVIEKKVGMIWSGTLFFPEDDIEFPLVNLFFHWVRCNALAGDTNCRSLQCAVETPALLSARDPLHCLL